MTKYDLANPARDAMYEYNQIKPSDVEGRMAFLKAFLGGIGEGTRIQAPFHCDVGENIFIGKNCFINYGTTFLDSAKIQIGDYVRIAPGCLLTTISHAIEYQDRANNVCIFKDIYIGDHVWLGGNVTILPGVTIGARSIIGAGSVVTKDIPPDVVAYGNPCRVIRKITENERRSE